MASRRLLAALPGALVLLTGLLAGPVAAQPPTIGSTHTFNDPAFDGTVFCDTLEQVRDIVRADAPNAIYALYRTTPNQRHEPICMALAPTGVVVDVTPIGNVAFGEDHYHAWAVETKIGAFTAYALYLEPFLYASI